MLFYRMPGPVKTSDAPESTQWSPQEVEMMADDEFLCGTLLHCQYCALLYNTVLHSNVRHVPTDTARPASFRPPEATSRAILERPDVFISPGIL